MHVPSSFFLLLLTPSSYLPYRTAVMSGLAQDHGLFVPNTLPAVAVAELESRQFGHLDDQEVCGGGRGAGDLMADIVRRT